MSSLVAALSWAGGCDRPVAESRAQLLEGALLPLCRELPTMAAQLDQLRLEPEQAGPLVQALLEPHRSRIGAMSALYLSLRPQQQRALFARVSRACQRELREFYVSLASISARVENEEEGRELVRPAVVAWRASGALWAFELFAQDTVAELQHMADGEEGERGAAHAR